MQAGCGNKDVDVSEYDDQVCKDIQQLKDLKENESTSKGLIDIVVMLIQTIEE